MNVVDDKQTDSTSENICMNIDMSINDDECINIVSNIVSRLLR